MLDEKIARLIATQQSLRPLADRLAENDLAIAYSTYRIKALVAALNDDITACVQQVAQQSEMRSAETHRELNSVILFIVLFALLALAITGYAGIYIYRNLGSSLTAIADAMTRLAQGEKRVAVPGLQRRDELGDLARAFNVFARNTASLAHTSRLLKEKSSQLESTFLAMRDGFALFDNQGQLVVWNAQYPQLLGLSGEALHRGLHYRQLLGRVGVDLQHPGEPQEVRLADGRTLELRFSPVPRRGIVNTVLERTARKALEEALVHSQKMKAVGQLTGGIAHDFNNLLAVIIGSLALTQGQLPPGSLASRIERARQAADRAALLTQRLLAFSRKQALHPRAVSVTQLVDELQNLLQHSLLPGQRLTVEAQRPGWLAWIDASQLENALMNLVVNARDAMQQRSGEIRLRIASQRREQGERVMIEVIDQGCGMTPDVREQVFEPFFTTKETGSGSGLGLSNAVRASAPARLRHAGVRQRRRGAGAAAPDARYRSADQRFDAARRPERRRGDPPGSAAVAAAGDAADQRSGSAPAAGGATAVRTAGETLAERAAGAGAGARLAAQRTAQSRAAGCQSGTGFPLI